MQQAPARIGEAATWPVPPGIRFGAITVDLAERIERLLDLAFGYDRHQRTAYRLRERTAALPDASFAAFGADGALAGSIQSWPIALATAGGDETALWLIGPIAVHPDRRNLGIGRAMLATALEALDATPQPALLIGDPAYYAPFGFSAARTGGWAMPGPVERHRLLLRARDGASLPRDGLLGPSRNPRQV